MTKQPLRVVYVIGYYADLTGSQRSLLAFLQAVGRHEVDPLVVFPGAGRCSEAYREAGVRVEILQAPPALDRFGGAIPAASWAEKLALLGELAPYAARFARLLARERADVAHFNDLRALLLCGPGAVLRPTPRVWHLRGDGRGLAAAQAAGAGLAHRIVCVADAVRATLPGWARARGRTVYNGIDVPIGAPSRTRAELVAAMRGDDVLGGDDRPGNGDELLVLMVGTLVPFKGAHHLVAAIAHLEQTAPELASRIHLVLIGDAPVPAYARMLEVETSKLTRARVRFTGWESRPLDWMRAADLVVVPTVARETLTIDGVSVLVEGTEGFPRTVLEAMACARPVVGTRVMGIAEQVVDGVTGALCAPSDVADLAHALQRVLALSREEREDLGAAGCGRVVERFSIRRNVEATLAVYRELVDEPISRR